MVLGRTAGSSSSRKEESTLDLCALLKGTLVFVCVGWPNVSRRANVTRYTFGISRNACYVL